MVRRNCLIEMISRGPDEISYCRYDGNSVTPPVITVPKADIEQAARQYHISLSPLSLYLARIVLVILCRTSVFAVSYIQRWLD